MHEWILSWSGGVADLPGCDAIVLPAALLPDLRISQPGAILGAQVLAFGPAEMLPIALMRGADEFLRTPWAAAELFARLRHCLLTATRASRRLGLSLQPGAVSSAATSVALSGAEYRILQLLLRFAGEVVDRQAFCFALWGRFLPQSRAVDVHISSLRRKLAQLASGTSSWTIQTVRGQGYVFIGHQSPVDNL